MSKHEVDEFFCKKCKKSMVGSDGICLNCGFDTWADGESPKYEDEDVSLFDDADSEDSYDE